MITNKKFWPPIMFDPFIDKQLANLKSCFAAFNKSNHLAVGAPTKTIDKSVFCSQKRIEETVNAYYFIEADFSGDRCWSRRCWFDPSCTNRTFEMVLSPLNNVCFASGMPEDPSELIIRRVSQVAM